MEMRMGKNKKMISVKEIAEETGISKRTLYRWMDEGKLPFPWYSTGANMRKAKLEDVRAWLEKVKREAGTRYKVRA